MSGHVVTRTVGPATHEFFKAAYFTEKDGGVRRGLIRTELGSENPVRFYADADEAVGEILVELNPEEHRQLLQSGMVWIHDRAARVHLFARRPGPDDHVRLGRLLSELHRLRRESPELHEMAQNRPFLLGATLHEWLVQGGLADDWHLAVELYGPELVEHWVRNIFARDNGASRTEAA
jgi:hypothetical protein